MQPGKYPGVDVPLGHQVLAGRLPDGRWRMVWSRIRGGQPSWGNDDLTSATPGRTLSPVKGREPHPTNAGPRTPSPRSLPLLSAAVLWVAIDVLLIRIASSGTWRDWDYLIRTSPLVLAALMTSSVINLVVAGVTLWRPTRGVLLATVAWGLLVEVFGVALIVRHDKSGGLVVVGALIASWLAYRAAGTLPERA